MSLPPCSSATAIGTSCAPRFGANGQGRTKQEARESLAAAIALILADRREDGLRAVPPDAERETVTVE